MLRYLLTIGIVVQAVLVHAGGAGDLNWQRVAILKMAQTPAIDGNIKVDEWAGATPLSGLVKYPTATIASIQPSVRVGWNDGGLLIAVTVPLPPGEKAKATATDWDGTVWQDDSVEVHIDHGHKHGTNYQFVVNALGTKLDSLAGDTKYNAEWQAAAKNEPGQWSAEFAIPWKAMGGGTPTPGQMDGFNIAVNGSTLGGILSWSPVNHGLHETAKFGHLIYGTSVAFGVTNLEAATLSETRGVIIGQDEVTVSLQLLRRGQNGANEPIDAVKQTIKAPGDFTIPVKIPLDQGFRTPGDYIVELAASSATGPLYLQRGDIKVGAPLTDIAQAFIGENYLNVIINLDPVSFPANQTDLVLAVSCEKGPVLDQKVVPDPKTGYAQVRIEGSKLPPGKFAIKTTATNRETGKSYATEKNLDNPLKPTWLGTKEGITGKVPTPWTPLKVEGDAVKPWGRVYRFNKSILPTEVVARGASVLSGPITLIGQVDGKPLRWNGQPVKFTSQKPDTVTMTGGADGGSVRLSGTASVEYDGMVRVDLVVSPTGDKATIQKLMLEIPLKPEHARYLYHFPGRWGSVDNSGFLPEKGWSHAFKPFVWLGDEDRGFSWFCESDQNWHPAEPNKAIEIVREQNRVVLRLNLVGKPVEVGNPQSKTPNPNSEPDTRHSSPDTLSYTFGFHATPVKEPEKTVWDYRITHHGTYGLERQPSVLGGVVTYPAEGHLKAEEGSFECWYRPGFDNTERGVPMQDRKQMTNRMIFTVSWGGDTGTGSNCGIYWNEHIQGPVGWSRKNGQVTHNPAAPFDWQAGRWYHLCMTWSDKIRIYVDGKLLSETPNNGFFPHPFKDAHIEIGGPGACATIDEVRILSVARPPSPSQTECQPDANTLMIDHFEDYDRKDAKTPGSADGSVSFATGRSGKGATWEPDKTKTQLERLAELGVRTICFHEHWSPYQSHPYVTAENRPKLRSLVDGVHEHGVSLLLYMSRQFADNAPEWELYSDEVLLEPRGGAYRRLPEQSAYNLCWNTPWKDFCLYHLGKLMDEFGHDGWYLDGPEWPMVCGNRHHGCGYVADDGTVKPTYDIFATRDFMKRLYVLTRKRKPQGQLNIHNSTVMVIPTLGWGTSSWGGEQIDAIKPPVKTLDILPMDSFRTEFMGRQWGVPSEFLVYDGAPYYAKDVLAYTLLHGVLIRPGDSESLNRTSALWKVYDQFPFKDAKVYAYWSNAEILTCSPTGIYATAYQKPKDGLLLFISNLGDNKSDVSVRLIQALPSKCKAWDALTGEAITLQNGTLRFPLETWRYRVVRVQ